MAVEIHPSSVVSPGAQLGVDVSIGPLCVIGPHVRIGDRTQLVSQVSIAGDTAVGADGVIYPFAALGHPPQDLRYRGERTSLVVGDRAVIREHVTMQLGTPAGRGVTRVGSNGFFMTGAHVGHDAIVGDHVVFANNATLGGFAEIADFVTMGGLSAVHQFGRVGRYAFIGGGAPVVGDVIPFGMVDNHGALHGLNLIGLKRRGFTRQAIHTLRGVYRELFHGDGVFEDRVRSIDSRLGANAEVRLILDFIDAGAKRPLCTPRA
jgi:UDP-N-acetylglucosamine acyltransferase